MGARCRYAPVLSIEWRGIASLLHSEALANGVSIA